MLLNPCSSHWGYWFFENLRGYLQQDKLIIPSNYLIHAEAEEGYREQNKNTTREDSDMPAVYLTGAYHCHPGGRSMQSSILLLFL